MSGFLGFLGSPLSAVQAGWAASACRGRTATPSRKRLGLDTVVSHGFCGRGRGRSSLPMRRKARGWALLCCTNWVGEKPPASEAALRTLLGHGRLLLPPRLPWGSWARVVQLVSSSLGRIRLGLRARGEDEAWVSLEAFYRCTAPEGRAIGEDREVARLCLLPFAPPRRRRTISPCRSPPGSRGAGGRCGRPAPPLP